jgi:3-oxoacyl-[acyl-carrier protein] reductase
VTTLSGKTTLVTGASRDTGRASVLALAAAGAQVRVHCSYGIKEADGVVTEIRKARSVCGKAARGAMSDLSPKSAVCFPL